MNRSRLTQQRLQSVMQYDEATGVFTWLVQRGSTVRPGTPAGNIQSAGYRQISVDGRTYVAHRLAWLYVHGRWPAHEIDHINGVRDDNRVANLREATAFQNRLNAGNRRVNKTGVPGVEEFKPGRWRVEIRVDGRRRHLGVFYDFSSAIAARKQAEQEESHAEFRAVSTERPRYPSTRPPRREAEAA